MIPINKIIKMIGGVRPFLVENHFVFTRNQVVRANKIRVGIKTGIGPHFALNLLNMIVR